MWLCPLLPVLVGALCEAALPGPTGWRLPGKSPRFDRPGDVVVGGSFSIFPFNNVTLFDFTAPPAGLSSSDVSRWGYRVAQGFVFAIEEINRDTRLLPNLTLGFSIRNSGDSVHGGMYEMLGFLSGQEVPIPNYVCGSSPPRVALIGETLSVLSVSMARLLGLYKFPQVSYSSTLPSLSDKTQFPSFLRTLASDIASSHAISQLVLHFRWSWVGILAQDDDFGQQASSLVSQELGQVGVCIEFYVHVPSQQSLEKADAIVRKMASSTATVILVFLSNFKFQLLLQGLQSVGISGQVWVSKGTLHLGLALAVPGASRVLHSSFGLLQQVSCASGFPEFLARLNPRRTPEDGFLERFWEVTFGCKWPPRSRGQAGKSAVLGGARFCSGNESLRGKEYPFQEVSKVDAAYSAVYSIAHALQALKDCVHMEGACADPLHLQPWQLLHPLRKVHFWTPDGEEIKFDANGDLLTKFDIHYGQKTANGLFHFVHIGVIDPRAPPGNRVVHLMKENLQVSSAGSNGLTYPPCASGYGIRCSIKATEVVQFWQMYSIVGLQVPSSVCSRSCAPGFSQVPQQGAPQCCFDCSPCPEGQFADQRDMKSCLPCPKEQYSSHTRDRCLPKRETFLAFGEPLGLTLASVALMLAGLAVLVLGVFLKHWDTPVVRANNRALSCTLLTSLALCALCPLLFLGRPTTATCLLRQSTFAVVFTVAVSSILAKTLTVVLAFRVTRPGGQAQVCLGPSSSSSVVLLASLMQVVLCGAWLGTSPPFPDQDMASEPSQVVLYCQEGSGLAFSCILAYLGVLAAGTFCVAFLGRSLPDAFNETRFLTFSMLLFCSIWTAFLPLYHSARGKHTVAVEVFSILASTAGLLGGIFLPKCYIILLRPERNTLAWVKHGRQAQQE